MNKATRLLPLPLIVLAVLTFGCGVPLPAPELTATAQVSEPAPEQDRAGSEVQSSSSGAPNTSALSLQQTSDDDEPPEALAPIEDDELAGTTVVPGDESDEASDETPEAEATPEPEIAEATEEPTQEPTQEPTPEPALDPAAYAAELLGLLNQYRTENGIPALQFDGTLTASAMAYAEFMGTSGFFGHYPASGSTPAGRIAAAGFTGQYQGEALSAGQTTPAVALSRLLGSSRHAAILLSQKPTVVGVGYAYVPGSYYGHYWVVVTANP